MNVFFRANLLNYTLVSNHDHLIEKLNQLNCRGDHYCWPENDPTLWIFSIYQPGRNFKSIFKKILINLSLDSYFKDIVYLFGYIKLEYHRPQASHSMEINLAYLFLKKIYLMQNLFKLKPFDEETIHSKTKTKWSENYRLILIDNKRFR